MLCVGCHAKVSKSNEDAERMDGSGDFNGKFQNVGEFCGRHSNLLSCPKQQPMLANWLPLRHSITCVIVKFHKSCRIGHLRSSGRAIYKKRKLKIVLGALTEEY